MSDPARPETDKAIVDRAVGPAERLLFGHNSIDGTVRMIGFIALFALVGGTVFYFLG